MNKLLNWIVFIAGHVAYASMKFYDWLDKILDKNIKNPPGMK